MHPGAANHSNGLKLSVELVALVRQNGKCGVGVAMEVCRQRTESSHYSNDIMRWDEGERRRKATLTIFRAVKAHKVRVLQVQMIWVSQAWPLVTPTVRLLFIPQGIENL